MLLTSPTASSSTWATANQPFGYGGRVMRGTASPPMGRAEYNRTRSILEARKRGLRGGAHGRDGGGQGSARDGRCIGDRARLCDRVRARGGEGRGERRGRGGRQSHARRAYPGRF